MSRFKPSLNGRGLCLQAKDNLVPASQKECHSLMMTAKQTWASLCFWDQSKGVTGSQAAQLLGVRDLH